MEEIWNKVRNYENYEVSNLGGARSLNYMHTGKIKLLKLNLQKTGYLQVTLYKNKKPITYKVHRLVWEAFNGEIPEGMQVNHINEVKTDNRLENLNLMTPKENSNWGTAIQRRVEKQKGVRRPYVNQNLCKTVLQFTLDGVLVKQWPSTKECCRNGFNQGHVAECCRGERKTYKGFIWKYKEC